MTLKKKGAEITVAMSPASSMMLASCLTPLSFV